MRFPVPLRKERSCCSSTPHFVNVHTKASTILSSSSAKEQTILAVWLKISTSSLKIVNVLKKIGYSKNYLCGGYSN